MKLIKPKQISGEIMTLIDESDEFVVIVSPYVQVKNWSKLKNTISHLKKRDIPVKFYFRKGNKEAKKEIESLGVESIAIAKLHCKIFMNEKIGIVSSMNLYEYSDSHSLDIAYKTETENEYKELNDFYIRYLRDRKKHKLLSEEEYSAEVIKELKSKLDGTLEYDFEEDEIIITYERSRYNFFIEKGELQLWGIFTRRQFEYAKSHKKIFKKSSLNYNLINGNGQSYDEIHTKLKVNSDSLNKLYKSDYHKLLKSMVEFIRIVDFVKKEEYKNREDSW